MADAIRYPVPGAVDRIPRDRHVVIEASAGTGKTFLIEHEVVNLLLRADVTIDQILVVTFTEKATTELRGRVRALIDKIRTARADVAAPGEPCWVIDDAARALLGRALVSFDAAPIYTIHGFCHRVLVDNAFANRRLFDQTQIDRGAAFAGAFRGALRDTLARDAELAPLLAQWLRAGRSVDDLERLLLACAEQGGRFQPAFDPERAAAAIAALPAVDAGELRDSKAMCVALKLAGVGPRSTQLVAERVAWLAEQVAGYRATGDLPALLDALERGRVGQARSSDTFIEYAVAKLTNVSVKDERVAQLVDFTLGLARAAVPLTSAVAQRFLPVVERRLADDKRRLGQFDFQDMLQLVWDSLEGPRGAELATALRARYRFALIDEFQDTDELQWKIFRRLFADGGAGNRLCIIGDPKQAIYGFRGADVRTYLAARQALIDGGGERIALTDNFRSTAGVVDAYNAILSQRAPEPLLCGEIQYAEPVVAAGDVRHDGPPLTLLRVTGAAKPSSDAIKAAVRAGIAAEAWRLIDEAPPFGRAGHERPLRPGDIFVLTRSFRETVEVSEALRAAGVPCALYKVDGLFQTREAADIRDLLRAIAAPRQQSERLKAWQTPFFEVPLAELLHARDLPDTHPLVERLVDWKLIADAQEFDGLFERIVADSGVLRRELFLRDSERAITNYLHLFELLLEEARSARCDLAELIRRLDAYIGERRLPPGMDANVQRLESEKNAVQLMTMHLSKGLEAAVVFLYGGLYSHSGGPVYSFHHGEDRCIRVGPWWGPGAAPESRGDDEDRRLIYVALTRAKARLYLPHVPGVELKGAYGPLHAQLERLADELPAIELPVEPSGRGAAVAVGPDPALAAWTPPVELVAPPDDDARYAAWRAERRGPIVTSYTRLKHHRHGDSELARDELDRGLDRSRALLRPDQLPAGAATGVFLHDVLEHVPLHSFAGAPAFDAWRRHGEVAALLDAALARHGIAAAHRRDAERMVYDALTTPACGLPALATVQGAQREVEFLFPAGRRGDDHGFVKGFIDMMFRVDDVVYLLDWKSDALDDDADLAAHVDAHYGLQARLYMQALARALDIHDSGDYRARIGGIVFCFLRGARFHLARPSWDELRASAREVAAFVAPSTVTEVTP